MRFAAVRLMRSVWTALLLTTTAGAVVFADTAEWSYSSDGDWSDSNNWLDTTTSVTPYTPTSSDDVYVNNGYISQVSSSGAVASTLHIDNGGLTISSGDLTVGGAILVGTVLNPATFTMSGGTVYANQFTIGSTATFSDSGSGAWVFTGSSPSIVNDSATAISFSSPITIQDSLTINASGGDVAISGIISESGGTYGLNLNGSYTVTLSGANTYSGDTYLNSGTLVVGNDSALGTGALYMNGGTLDVQDGQTHTLANNVTLSANGTVNTTSGNLVLSGVISESGGSYGLVVNGGGSLTLSGANTYSGDTTINGGTLVVANSSALGVGSVNLVSGTLAVNPLIASIGGNYTQSDGVLQLAIGGTGSGEYAQLNVTGTATFNGGTLQVVASNSYQPRNQDQVTLVVSSGLTGIPTLDNQISASAMLQASFTLDPDNANNLILSWSQLSFVPYALTANQQAVAQNLTAAANDSRMATAIYELDYLPGGTAQLPAAFDLISPQQLTSMFTLGFAGADVQGYNLLNRVRDLRNGSSGFSASGLDLHTPTGTLDLLPQFQSSQPADIHVTEREGVFRATPDNPWGVFVGGAGEFVDVQGDQNADGYHLTSGGLAVGADYRLNEQLAVGLALGYANSTADLTGDGRVTVNSGRADVYGVWFNDGFHMEGMLGGGYSGYDTRRDALGSGGTTSSATGSTDGSEVGALLSGGYDWQKGPWTYGPQALLQYTRVDVNGFTESGSLLPLEIQSQNADSLRSQLGGHVVYKTRIGRVVLMPELRIGWRHEYMDRSVALDSRFANGAGGLFTVRGTELGKDSAVVGLGLSAQWTQDISTYVNYDTELGRKNYSLHSVSAGVRIRL